MKSTLQKIADCFIYSWYDIGKDYGLPIGLGIFALISAYFIFYKETKRDKQKENEAKIQERHDKLLFLSSMVKNVISISRQMEDNIKILIEKIKQDPIHFHLIEFVPLHDLRRMTSVIDIEKYMLAYVEHFSQNRKKSVSDFGSICYSPFFGQANKTEICHH